MSSSTLTLLAFLSGTLIVGSVLYLLLIPIRAIAGGFSSGTRRLRRIPTVFDDAPATSKDLTRQSYSYRLSYL